ncbi:hypothetical protein L2E82_41980 [Cichorium intybus]|uniref:Uncharacterized protein n=1 Tax=Cichorium intybus TaxID=13427 RepID=A0ACB8ZKD5_CICIN|nr:hypothetical protein L2E82_41980 [Cichorium intybus]
MGQTAFWGSRRDGMWKPHHRIYYYAPYNDLGRLDKSPDLARSVLGVPATPYVEVLNEDGDVLSTKKKERRI